MKPLSKFSSVLADSLAHNLNLIGRAAFVPTITVLKADDCADMLAPILNFLSATPGATRTAIGTLTPEMYDQAAATGKHFTADAYSTLSVKDSVLFYSGGLESSLSALSSYGQDVIYVEGIKELCSAHNVKLIEPVLLYLASELRYSNCTIGATRAYKADGVGALYEYGTNALSSWAKALGMSIHTPMGFFTKKDLMPIALNQGIKFHSCDHDHAWCGDCWSCFETEALCRALRKPSPVRCQKSAITRYLSQIEHTRLTGQDWWYGENHAVLAYENEFDFDLGELTHD